MDINALSGRGGDEEGGDDVTGHYVDGRDVAAELRREFLALATGADPQQQQRWTPAASSAQGVAVEVLQRPTSVVVRTRFALPLAGVRAFPAFFADPRAAPRYDVFVRDVELVERLDRASGMYILRLVTPAGSRVLPLFHTVHSDPLSRFAVAVWRSVDADASWRAAHVPQTPPSPPPPSAPQDAGRLCGAAPWQAVAESGLQQSLPTLGIGTSGFLVESDPHDPNVCRIVHVLHVTGLADPNALRATFGGLHGGHVASNLLHLVQMQAQTQTQAPNPWDLEEKRLEFELYCVLTSPLHAPEWKPLEGYPNKDIRFRFARAPDGGIVFAVRGCFDSDANQEAVAQVVVGKSPEWNFLVKSKANIASTANGTVVHTTYNQFAFGQESESVTLDVVKKQPDGCTVFAFRSVDFPGAPRDKSRPLFQFLPSGFYASKADDATIISWVAAAYIAPDQQEQPQQPGAANDLQAFTFLSSVITGLCSALQGAMSGHKQTADIRKVYAQLRAEFSVLGVDVATELPPPWAQQINNIFELLSRSELVAGTSKGVPHVPTPPQQSHKRGRDVPQTELVFVSNVVFTSPHKTPPLDGRPFLFLKRHSTEPAPPPVSRKLSGTPPPVPIFAATAAAAASVKQLLPPLSALAMATTTTATTTTAAEPIFRRPFFDILSDELIKKVLSFLTVESIAASACTCKRFRDIVRTPQVWETAYAKNHLQLEMLQSNTAPIDPKRACLESAAVWKSWRLKIGRMYSMESSHNSRINALLFADQGRCILSGGSDRIVKIFKTSGPGTGYSCINTFSGVKAGVVGMDSTDQMIFAGYRNGQVRIWDIHDWKLLFSHQPCHKTEGYVFLHPHMVSWEEEIKVWHEDTAAPIAMLSGHTRKVVGVAEFTRATLVSCSLDRTIKIWDLRTASCPLSVRGLTGSTTCIGLFLHNTLATCSTDGSLQLWDMRQLSNGPQLILREHRGPVRCLKYGFGRLATGSDDSTVRIWDTNTFRCQQVFSEDLTPVSCVDMSSNALAVGTTTGLIKVFEFQPFSQRP